jgi:hypothetical protein
MNPRFKKQLALNYWLPLAAAAALALQGTSARAVEGMWTPDQLPEIEARMRQLGLEMPAGALSDLTGFPFGAVISLGGCSASFVSPEGLVVTNHHCARGSVQYNSTPEHNYLADGFVATTRDGELRAAPGARVYVTTKLTDVTGPVTGGLPADMPPRERYQAMDDRKKQLVAECEAPGGLRCVVASFHGGAQYKLVERLEIRDVRLVYAPGDSIGKYGGDVDNWMWPRHTGDFSFYRAYVGPDGRPADFSKDNVPFRPKHFLQVSRAGLKEGDFIMVAGYPGRTNRYARLSEVEHTFGWYYPAMETLLRDWITTIEAAAPEGSDARIKYEARLSGLNNYMKNLGGQIEGARRVGLVERRQQREAALLDWVATRHGRTFYRRSIDRLEAVIADRNRDAREQFWFNNALRPQLLAAAHELYRLSRERQKPDAEREPGYQDRDLRFIRERMEAIERRYDPQVDRAEWLLFLQGYLSQPAGQRVAALDTALDLPARYDRAALEALLVPYYRDTRLGAVATRLAWMDRNPADFEASNDPFIRLAIALYPYRMAREEADKVRDGSMQALRPEYMNTLIAWNAAQGNPVYPDANGTLRVTYGTVFGGSPRDGILYEPFTRLEGIVEKDTGQPPFDAPARLLERVAARDYGPYELASIGSVPVNFLSDLDVTGGNSGSATLDARGHLVGLLFDGTLESVNSDWDFDVRTTRSIHVDTRYMLWVMEKVDGAGRLVEEMTLATTP